MNEPVIPAFHNPLTTRKAADLAKEGMAYVGLVLANPKTNQRAVVDSGRVTWHAHPIMPFPAAQVVTSELRGLSPVELRAQGRNPADWQAGYDAAMAAVEERIAQLALGMQVFPAATPRPCAGLQDARLVPGSRWRYEEDDHIYRVDEVGTSLIHCANIETHRISLAPAEFQATMTYHGPPLR